MSLAKTVFKISDIPEGKSSRTIVLGPGELELEYPQKGDITVDVHFERRPGSILVDFDTRAVFVLRCDRSLDNFDQEVVCNYRVLFKQNEVVEEDDEKMATRLLDISGNKMSITDELRDSILLEIPVKKLHPRFYDEHGEPLPFEKQFGPSGEPEEDPRWDALKQLKNKINKN
jgi:uncharacterized metal-binding protein YceD (DUF177 family)